ncbi:MAG TPA: 3',5'-cyclic-nucleotide phosphodiesterase [Methylomirabilota bacterium]|jgi:cAMP phosphodiesterase|nr:3',5'-cyclic-nucleotide phosphodiesterase [Methylomirabilota bacterium]
MRLEVLGCHGGDVPNLRLPTFLVNGRVLLEAGAVTAALPLEKQADLQHVLISHAHLDHIVGLAFLVDNIQSAARSRSVTTASLAPIIKDLRTYCFNNRLWPDFTALPSAEAPVLRLETLVEGEPTEFGDLSVIPVPVNHAVPATGFVVSDGTSGFVFSGDTGPTKQLWRVARHVPAVRAVVVETAFPNRLESLARASGHLTPKLLEHEIEKMPDGPIWIYHIKPAYYEETADQLSHLDGRVEILQQDHTYTF